MAKKVTKKKTVRKTVKKAAPKKTIKSFLKNVKAGEEFLVCEGSVYKNLLDLANGLDALPDGAFYFHVNDHKNDFANWIDHCVGQKTLGKELQGTINKHVMQVKILKYIVAKVV